MEISWFGLFTFAIITTFTPGPNNLSSASMGVRYGYKYSIRYLLGIASGFLIIMLLCTFFSSSLGYLLNVYEKYIRVAGALYILWLALSSLKLNYEVQIINEPKNSYFKGLVLQFVNPKGMLYGLTMYSTFLNNLTDNLSLMILLAIIFALLCFISISTWALFGATIIQNVKNKKLKYTINIILCLMLIYIATDISGLAK